MIPLQSSPVPGPEPRLIDGLDWASVPAPSGILEAHEIRIGGDRWLVPSAWILGRISPTWIVPLKGTRGLVGVVRSGDWTPPIVDPRPRLGLEKSTGRGLGSVVLLGTSRPTLGLLVDEVVGKHPIRIHTIRKTDAATRDVEAHWATVREGGELYRCLSLPELLAPVKG